MILPSLCLAPLLFGLELSSHPEETVTGLGMIGFGLLMGWIYLRQRASRTADPILIPRFMRIPTFGNSMIAGSITRITQGAYPLAAADDAAGLRPLGGAERGDNAGDGARIIRDEVRWRRASCAVSAFATA